MVSLTELTLFEIGEVMAEYEVRYVSGDMFDRKGRSNISGYCDFEERVIYINRDQTEENRTSTFFHEASHAYHEMYGLKDSESHTSMVERNSMNEYRRLRDGT